MVLSGFEYLGTVAFAISGAMVGIRKEMDVFGIAVLAVTTALRRKSHTSGDAAV